MKFGKLELEPAINPGVLDTETWSPSAAWDQTRGADFDWAKWRNTAIGNSPRATSQLCIWPGSIAQAGDATWCLATLQDGQSVFCCVGRQNLMVLPGKPLGQLPLDENSSLTVFSTDADNVDRYCRQLVPEKGPRALGATPRLGIGTRMTTQVWPGIFDAMESRDMAANSIQNSIRELSLLDDLREARPPESNFSTGVGQIETGWTGSTYEGLWVAGVLAALKSDKSLRYGADADHVQVKRGPAGLERAQRVIRAARYYSFFTLDMADVLNYAALDARSASAAEALIAERIPNATERRGIVEYHMEPFTIGGQIYRPDAPSVARFVGKYWETLHTVGELANYIASLKQGVEFDLELTIDEHPPEVAAFDCLTSDEELLFLARECQRRELPISHLAPNFGQEKGHDYRAPDGLEGLECRVRSQYSIASAFGLTLDVHSGDDLASATRQVFGRATGGQLVFKVSPMLQLIYARLLQDFHPALFERWWHDALAYARREADKGSTVAQHCLTELSFMANPQPSPNLEVFHYYSFPFVGRRDPHGQFLHRHEFYQLSSQFYEAYRQEVCNWLCELAEDVSLA